MNILDKTATAHRTAFDLAAGDFDHSEWNKAARLRITRLWSGENTPASRHAEAQILWSDNSICVRFLCKQSEPPIVSARPQTEKKTIGLWRRDVCEIFVSPEPNAPGSYFEFEAAPTGEWLDLAIQITPEGRETDWEFQSGMTAAASLGENETIIAMRIPWSDSIPKPQSGDAWRVNLFRCIGTGDERYLAWQPTYTPEPNFHVPDAFGWLRFA